MDKITCSGSDSGNNGIYEQCHQSTERNELDFVDRWVDLTVEKEVLRGCKLREEKLKSYPNILDCQVVNIDLTKSPCYAETSYLRKSLLRNKVGTNPCSTRSNSPIYRRNNVSQTNTQPSVYSKCHTQAKSLQRCPMRIAELAVPTKRQCIDTWRSKCDVLPPCMVERLKQQVMDEKPVVQISEAITCFKRRRPKSSKSNGRRPKKINRESKQMNERIAEIRKWCAAFADRIAVKLIQPQNIDLNPELAKLSNVIANEITKIIQDRKKYPSIDLNNNSQRKIQADISAKIAVWIATILEDTSYKLLEADLKVKKHLAREIKEDQVITLIEDVQQERAAELEEEEGPVLDFLDDLVNNVVTICNPESIDILKDDISKSSSIAASDERYDDYDRSIESADSNDNNDIDSSTHYTNKTYDIGDGTNTVGETKLEAHKVIPEKSNEPFDENELSEGIELSIHKHIKGEIDEIINSIGANNDITIEEKQNFDENDRIQDETIENISQSPGNSELTTQIKQVESVPDIAAASNSDKDDEIDDKKLVDPKDNKLVDFGDNKLVEEVNEAFDRAEESPDENNKKVKFSEIDIATRGIAEKIDKDSFKPEESYNSREKAKVSWNPSTDSIKRDLVLAPPNDNLLSDADESWPDDIATPVLKPSASVSRSVTSLGRILEKDEKFLMPEDEIRSELNWDSKETAVSDDPNNKNVGLLHTEDLLIELNESKEIPEGSVPSQKYQDSNLETYEPAVLIGDGKMLNVGKDMINQLIKTNEFKCDLETHRLHSDKIESPQKSLDFSKRYDFEENRLMQATLAQIARNANDIENIKREVVPPRIKISYALPEAKLDYKVRLNTAPSWLKGDNGKGEPSEDSFRDIFKAKPKFKESDIRSWCKDLDRMFLNLEMWNGWVDTTCKNILYFKQKKELNKHFAPYDKRKEAREWMTLKKNIDKDTVLWTKLNQQAYKRVKNYKNKLKNVSTEYSTICDCKNNPRGK